MPKRSASMTQAEMRRWLRAAMVEGYSRCEVVLPNGARLIASNDDEKQETPLEKWERSQSEN